MARDYDPVQGQWFEDLEENEVFKVLSVDPDQELVEIQYENGDIEEIDLDTWHELDLERAEEPEGWASDDEQRRGRRRGRRRRGRLGRGRRRRRWDDDDDDDLDDDDDDYSDRTTPDAPRRPPGRVTIDIACDLNRIRTQAPYRPA